VAYTFKDPSVNLKLRHQPEPDPETKKATTPVQTGIPFDHWREFQKTLFHALLPYSEARTAVAYAVSSRMPPRNNDMTARSLTPAGGLYGILREKTPSIPVPAKHWLLAILTIVLYVLHQDVWLWTSARPLAFGFLPAGLFYHAVYTLAAAGLMMIAVRWAWPSHLE
jgi:hypothetical protein